MELSEPIKSFLKVYGERFTDKEILPFETQGGFGIGSCIQQLNDFLQKAGARNYQIRPALIVDGNRVDEADETVANWLRKVRA